MIAKLYNRPYKGLILQVANGTEGREVLHVVRFIDISPNNFEIWKEVLPLMKRAYKEGREACFTKEDF